jgi:hypothetical protein
LQNKEIPAMSYNIYANRKIQVTKNKKNFQDACAKNHTATGEVARGL